MVNFPHPCEDTETDDPEDIDAIVISLLGCALSEVFQHILGDKGRHPHLIGVRTIAVINEMRPDLLNGRSLRALAKEAQCTPAALSHIATTFRDRVGRFSHPLVEDRVRAMYAQRARAVHNGTWKASPEWELRKHQASIKSVVPRGTLTDKTVKH